MNPNKQLIGLICCVLFSPTLAAQNLSAAEIEQEQHRLQSQRNILFAQDQAQRKVNHHLPQQTAVQKQLPKIEKERKEVFDPHNPAIKQAARVFPNIPTPARSGIGIEDTVKQYQQTQIAQQTENLMIFASFTMPQESLKRLVQQANKVGATVIMRGFKGNTIKATALAIRELGEHGGNIVINPNSFEKYQIQAVPTVVLTKANRNGQTDKDGHASASSFIAIAGDVSLDYALADIARQMPNFSEEANRYLWQIRGR